METTNKRKLDERPDCRDADGVQPKQKQQRTPGVCKTHPGFARFGPDLIQRSPRSPSTKKTPSIEPVVQSRTVQSSAPQDVPRDMRLQEGVPPQHRLFRPENRLAVQHSSTSTYSADQKQFCVPPSGSAAMQPPSASSPRTAPSLRISTPGKYDCSPAPLDYSPARSDYSQAMPDSPAQIFTSPTQCVPKEKVMPALEGDEDNNEEMETMPQLHMDAITRCREVFGCYPKPEQLQVLENIDKGRDTMLIAPCGWGKSLALFLPSVCPPEGIIVVISPLKALMRDQEKKLKKYGISHTVLIERCSTSNIQAVDDQAVNNQATNDATVNTDVTVNGDTIRRILRGEYQVVLMSPEIAFENSLVSNLWESSEWTNKLKAIFVDEVHCVDKWDDDFRPCYYKLGDLRRDCPSVPIIGLTATLTKDALATTKKSLNLHDDTMLLHVMESRTNLYLSLDVLPHRDRYDHLATALVPHTKTIVYFDNVSTLNDVYYYIRDKRLDLRIGVYFALLHDEYKEIVMGSFERGNLDVLLATEAAGMDCDIRGVTRVIQYGFPRDMTSLMQRFGRAGREADSEGFGILMAPALKNKESDQHLREFYNGGCRWATMDRLFGVAAVSRTLCCDVCDKTNNVTPRLHRRQKNIPFNPVVDPESSNRTKKAMNPASLKNEALQILDTLAAVFLEEWENKRPISTADDMIPEMFARVLAENFFLATTPEAVEAMTGNWHPIGGLPHFKRIADVLRAFHDNIIQAACSTSRKTI